MFRWLGSILKEVIVRLIVLGIIILIIYLILKKIGISFF